MQMTDTPSPTTTTTTPQDPATADRAPRRKFLDLSMTQVVAGSMAAATAAALGSTLGVAGTIIGAAVASVIAAVASAVYSASLARTQHGVRQVLRRTTTPTGPRSESGTAPAKAVETEPVPAATTLQPEGGARPAGTGWFASPRGQQVRGVLVGAVGAFAIAAVGITGFEFVTGHSVSGGDGTTIQRVIVHRPVDPSDSGDQAPGTGQESPAQQDGDPTGSESDEPTTSPTDEPSDSPPATPTEDPTESEGTTDPTSEPTPSNPESSGPSESPDNSSDNSSDTPSSRKPSTNQQDSQQDSQQGSPAGD